MYKILRIINRFNLGGPTYNAAYLTKYMAPEFETILIGGEKESTEDSSEFIVRGLGIEPILIPQMHREISPTNDTLAYRKIKKIIKEFKPHIVHTHASKAGIIGRLAALQCHVPVIVHTFHGHVFHSYFNSYKTAIFRNIERQLAKRTDKIIAVSQKQKYELAEVYKITPSENIQVIPLGFDLLRFNEKQEEKRSEFRKKYQLQPDEIAIGIVGRLVPVKNHKLFVEGIKYLKEHSTKKIRAFIVGDGESRTDIEKHIKALNLDYCFVNGTPQKASITFTSWIKEVDYVYAGLDLVALTSFNEGTPVSLIEAQAANKPIIATNIGGIEDIVTPDTAVLVQSGLNQQFFDKLLELIQNDQLRNRLSKNGWNYVQEQFHYTRLVSDMKKLYFDLLNKKTH